MTMHTRVTQGQMNSLKLQTINAMFTVFDREVEARDARKADLARKLHSQPRNAQDRCFGTASR